MCCTECSVCICRKVVYEWKMHIRGEHPLNNLQIWFLNWSSNLAKNDSDTRVHLHPIYVKIRPSIPYREGDSYWSELQKTPHVCKSVPWLYKYACSKVGRSGELLGEPCEMLLSTCLRKLCIFRSASDSKGRLAKQKWGMCCQ